MKTTFLMMIAVLIPAVASTQQPRQAYVLNQICPVIFGAEAKAAPLMTLTANGSAAPVRTVSLQFGSRDGRNVDSATVTIRGVTQSHLYLLIGSGSEEKQERTFHIESRAGSNGFTQSDLSVTGITALRTAEVKEIRFTDGTLWHPAGIAGCIAYFNGVHLVNAESVK